MRNGYAMCSSEGLSAITGLLAQATDELRNTARGRLVLEATYEATMLVAAGQAGSGVSRRCCSPACINDAIVRALGIVEHTGLDVRLVSYGSVDPAMRAIAENWAGQA
jgi:hypothetical protein